MAARRLIAGSLDGAGRSARGFVTLPSQSVPPTKLFRPRLRRDYVSRPRLINQLNLEADRKLTVVCGPAGYGKSTLVGQWLEQQSIPSVWVSPGWEDNNLRSFSQLLAAGLRTFDHKLLSKTGALLANPVMASDQAVFDQVIADLSSFGDPLVIVLDDFHMLDAPEIGQAVNKMPQQLPESIRLVVISRSIPRLNISRLRANCEICEIGPDDLAFTVDETGEFVQLRGLDLTDEQVAALAAATEGWVAALNLIGLNLLRRSQDPAQIDIERFALSRRSAFSEYLWDEVFAMQPREVQEFLLSTSILNRFSADLCNEVAQIGNARALIEQCARDNLFLISLDPEDHWFRFHHLFVDLLHDKLYESWQEEEIATLHCRASRWFEHADLIEDAIRHAIAGNDWDRATSLLEVVCQELFDAHQLVALDDWLGELPREALERRPRLAFFLAWARTRLGRRDESAEPLRIAEDAWTHSGDIRGLGLLRLLSGLSAMQSGDYLSAIACSRSALESLSKEHPVEYALCLALMGSCMLFHGNPRDAERVYIELREMAESANFPLLQSMEKVHHGASLMFAGNLRESDTLLRTAIAASEHQPAVLWMQAAHLYLGLINLELGLLSDALHALTKAEQLSDAMHSLTWKPQIHSGLARVHWAMGERQAAFAAAETAKQCAIQLGTRQEIRNARALEGLLFIATNQCALAHRWADANIDHHFLRFEYEYQPQFLTYVRLLIAEGNAKRAREILSELGRFAEVSGRHGDLVVFDILEVLARHAEGDTSGARTALERALDRAGATGYFQSFVFDGQVLAPYLRHIAVRKVHPELVNRLLVAIDGQTAPAMSPDQSHLVEPLSTRELEILLLVKAGLANRDIGGRLFISEKTVKKHLSNILGKLGAANRTQAVDEAQRLSII